MSEARHLQQFVNARQTRSTAMRVLNAMGKVAPYSMRLNADALWKAAGKSKSPSMGAIAAEPLEETRLALAELVESINSSTRLNLVGRLAAFDDSKRLARNHLRIQALLQSQPSIIETAIPDPVFIIGMPRTGTTYLHTLLAQNPQHRTIPYWESFDPIPPVNGSDTRKERLANMLKQMDLISPNYQAIHPMTAESTEECVALFMNEFRTIQFDVQYRVPEYVTWMQSQDGSIAYERYLQQLQIVQHFRPHGKRFVLKDPAHTLNIKTILKVFPQAKFVFTHRDPAKSLSSICSLYAYTRSMFSDAVNAESIGKEIINGYWPPGLLHAMQVRAALPKHRYADVRQKDLREDPFDAIRRVYAELNMEFDKTAQNALQQYLALASSAPRHTHKHSPESFGLKAEEIRERMQGYVQAFDL